MTPLGHNMLRKVHLKLSLAWNCWSQGQWVWRDEALGNLAKADRTILYIGLWESNRTKSRKGKKSNCLKYARGNMTGLAEHDTAFLQDVIEQTHGDASDMFNRVYFSALSETVAIRPAAQGQTRLLLLDLGSNPLHPSSFRYPDT